MQVYSLYLAGSAICPTSHNYPWSQDLFVHKPLQLPGEHIAWLPFSAHGIIQTHKPSLSYQVPTYSWVKRVHVWAKCLVWEHNIGACSARPEIEPAISRLYIMHATTEPQCPTIIQYSFGIIFIMHGRWNITLQTTNLDFTTAFKNNNNNNNLTTTIIKNNL